MKTYSFHRADGTFLSVTYAGSEKWLEGNTPSGCTAIEGAFDFESQRVDLVSGDVVAYQPPPQPIPTLDALRSARLGVINAAFEQAAQALTAGYPAPEQLTWPTQQAEALAWAANNSAPTPYLDGIASARGITVESMRQKTLESVQQFMGASQYLVGVRQRLRDAIDAATDEAALSQIKWPTP